MRGSQFDAVCARSLDVTWYILVQVSISAANLVHELSHKKDSWCAGCWALDVAPRVN